MTYKVGDIVYVAMYKVSNGLVPMHHSLYETYKKQLITFVECTKIIDTDYNKSVRVFFLVNIPFDATDKTKYRKDVWVSSSYFLSSDQIETLVNKVEANTSYPILNCCECNISNSYAVANLNDGRHVCYSCRSILKWKYSEIK